MVRRGLLPLGLFLQVVCLCLAQVSLTLTLVFSLADKPDGNRGECEGRDGVLCSGKICG